VHTPTTRLSRVQQYGGSDELLAMVQQVLPRIAGRVEDCAMVLPLSAFWGLILFLAMMTL